MRPARGRTARAAIGMTLAGLALTVGAHVAAQPMAKVPRVGVLSAGSSTESPAVQREPFERGLRELGWVPGMSRARVGAVLVRADTLVLEPNRSQIVALASHNRLPVMYPWRFYVDAGGLMSYAESLPAFHHRSATYVDRILEGAKPADLPVEQLSKFELVVNLRAARALELTIPHSFLLRADEFIE